MFVFLKKFKVSRIRSNIINFDFATDDIVIRLFRETNEESVE